MNKNYVEKIRNIEEYLENLQKKSKEIQSKFSFKVPNYVLSEIVENEGKVDYSNVFALLNLAVANGRITRENANKFKEYYR